MNTKNDGGPAFPIPIAEGLFKATPYSTGMSLRDWFAGMYIRQEAAVQPIDDRTKADFANIAAQAYAYADAMLAERQKS